MAVATSANYNKIIALPGGKKFHSGAHVDFADGTSIEMDDRNIMQGYPSIDDKVSEDGKFEVGGAYSSLLTLKLNNFPDKTTGAMPFADYNFKGAVIRPWIGLTTAVHWKDGEIVEKVPKGVFTVTEAPEVNSIISITGYDNLSKMDVKYADKSTLAYPATLAQIAADVCSVCGVNLATAAFPNSDYSVAKRPDSKTITCREILKYVAQLAGCFAKCNRDGDVEIRWYEAPEHVFDIGKNASSVTVSQNDTKITGVQIKASGNDGEVYKAGTDDFAIRIQDNPLAQDGLQNLVNALGTQLINTTFRSYSTSTPQNPAVETGDIVYLTDKKGIKHTTIVSSLKIEFESYETFGGSAESEKDNQSARFDKADKAQESADDAQQTADDAQNGVKQAETEISQLNGEITLKADKGKLISQINVCPESIKISSDKIEITGEVVMKSDLEDGYTTINGACIQTGRIEAENGNWWLDLDSGNFYLSGGEFVGNLKLGNQNYIEYVDGTMCIEGPSVSISGYRDTAGNETSLDVIGKLSITGGAYDPCLEVDQGAEFYDDVDFKGNISVDGDNGKTEMLPVTGSDGSTMNLHFKNGIYVSRD